ncbi:hypothetical protein FOZ63_029029 [Perkinsus olseni]|uniref:Uncharacterized protein n=1 Tax=Perkinsus olseni TaxID=32597 RepID=A0A7J6SVW6_PEROL|nr:hypothetical protein FOZ63_029029 [Perkinsus olseni]
MANPDNYTVQNRMLRELHKERLARIESHSEKAFVKYGDEGLWLKELKGKALGTQRWASGDKFATMLGSHGRYEELDHFFQSCVNGVELGCGVGVAGLMLAKMKPELRMTLTDLPECIPLAKENVDYNNLNDRVAVVPYSWGAPVDQFQANPPDLILATDVLYHHHLFDPFLCSLEAFAALREDKSIKVAIAYQPRTGDDRSFVQNVLLPRLDNVSAVEYEDPGIGSSTRCVVFLGQMQVS